MVGIGLSTVAEAMPDAVLVSTEKKSKEVKQLVSVLKADGFWQAENSPKDHRPWGWFESLALSESFPGKKNFC